MSEVENPRKHKVNSSNVYIHGQSASRDTMHEIDKYKTPLRNSFEPRSSCGFSSSSCLTRNGTSAHQMEYDQYDGDLLKWGNTTNVDTVNINCSSEMTATNGSVKANSGSQSIQMKISKFPKSTSKVSGEQYHSEVERKGKISNESSQTGNLHFIFLFFMYLALKVPLILYAFSRSCQNERYQSCTGKQWGCKDGNYENGRSKKVNKTFQTRSPSN